MNKAVIKATIAPIMPEPGCVHPLSDECLHGMVVKILNCVTCEGEDWFYVETHYRYRGYISGKFLSFGNVERWSEGGNFLVVEGFSADVTDKPDVRGRIVKNLTRGCVVKAAGENLRGYEAVELADGSFGFVRTKLLVFLDKPISNEALLRKNVLKTAETYLGSPYRWGGKTPFGIDCSGLCSMAYLLNGVAIYRDAEIKEGFTVKKIPFEQIQTADLIYFKGHVAMYAENGRYIHSSAGNDGVYYNSFNKNDVDYREDLAGTVKYCGSIFA